MSKPAATARAVDVRTLAEQTQNNTRIYRYPPFDFRPLGDQSRHSMDQAALEALADSIREVGLQQPIIVRNNPGLDENGRMTLYEIIAGHRRWMACQMAGLTTIPCIVREMGDQEAMGINLLENLQRENLNAIDEARGYKAYLERTGATQAELGKLVGKGQSAIANSLRLLDLPEDVLARIISGEISGYHGRALLKYKAFPKVVSWIAAKAAEKKWAARDLDGRLPEGWYGLEQEKLVVQIYTAHFDTDTHCKKDCPHGAYHDGYCLQPSHFNKLQAEEAARRRDQVNTLREEALSKGDSVPSLKDLPAGSFVRMDHSWQKPPAACREDCEKRLQVVGTESEIIPICTDPSCWRKLETAVTKAEKKSKRDIGKKLRTLVAQRAAEISEVGSREMALVATLALSNVSPSIMRDVYLHHLGLDLKSAPDAHGYIDWEKAREKLQIFTPLQLVRMAVEGVLCSEISHCYDSYGGATRKTDWYLQLKPGTAEPVDLPAPQPQPSPEPVAPAAGACLQPATHAIPYYFYDSHGQRQDHTVFACSDHLQSITESLVHEHAGQRFEMIRRDPVLPGKILCGSNELPAFTWDPIAGFPKL